MLSSYPSDAGSGTYVTPSESTLADNKVRSNITDKSDRVIIDPEYKAVETTQEGLRWAAAISPELPEFLHAVVAVEAGNSAAFLEPPFAKRTVEPIKIPDEETRHRDSILSEVLTRLQKLERMSSSRPEPEYVEKLVTEKVEVKPVQQKTPTTELTGFLATLTQPVSPPTFTTHIKMGSFSIRSSYHHVEVTDDVIILIVDTRDTTSSIVLPQGGDDEIELAFPDVDNTRYTCQYLDMMWSLDFLDFICLLRVKE